MAVDELEDLHRELDVADPAGAALQLAVGESVARDLSLHARLQRADGAEIVGGERMGPEATLRGLEPLVPECRVPRDGHRLEQGLELPRLGPLVPVGLVGVERTDERTVPSLGSEVGVDPEAAAGDLHDGPCPRSSRARGPSPTNMTSMSLE